MFLSLRHLLLVPAVALTAAVAVQACSLNPQPLPPGDTPEGGAGVDIPADASLADGAPFGGGGADAGSALGDGQAPGTPGPGDGASDGGASGDGATDAPSDGPLQGSDDGSTE
jgi:hypothetical protein